MPALVLPSRARAQRPAAFRLRERERAKTSKRAREAPAVLVASAPQDLFALEPVRRRAAKHLKNLSLRRVQAPDPHRDEVTSLGHRFDRPDATESGVGDSVLAPAPLHQTLRPETSKGRREAPALGVSREERDLLVARRLPRPLREHAENLSLAGTEPVARRWGLRCGARNPLRHCSRNARRRRREYLRKRARRSRFEQAGARLERSHAILQRRARRDRSAALDLHAHRNVDRLPVCGALHEHEDAVDAG